MREKSRSVVGFDVFPNSFLPPLACFANGLRIRGVFSIGRELLHNTAPGDTQGGAFVERAVKLEDKVALKPIVPVNSAVEELCAM
jgi:hypothetical protein